MCSPTTQHFSVGSLYVKMQEYNYIRKLYLFLVNKLNKTFLCLLQLCLSVQKRLFPLHLRYKTMSFTLFAFILLWWLFSSSAIIASKKCLLELTLGTLAFVDLTLLQHLVTLTLTGGSSCVLMKLQRSFSYSEVFSRKLWSRPSTTTPTEESPGSPTTVRLSGAVGH